MNLHIPTAPKRRGNDTWRSYVPGAVIIGAGVVLHATGHASEHVTTAVIALGATRLPVGRFRDGKRWKLAENTRTDEHQGRRR